MTIDKITKKEWNDFYQEGIDAQAKELLELNKKLQEANKNYGILIKTYEVYRKEIKTYRINHLMDFENGIISYTLGTKRRIGYKTGEKK